MAAPKTSHLRVALTRDLWIRRDHIAGESIPENERATRVARKGEELSILRDIAVDLMLQESAIEVKPENQARIRSLKEESKAEVEAFQKAHQNLKKAA